MISCVSSLRFVSGVNLDWSTVDGTSWIFFFYESWTKNYYYLPVGVHENHPYSSGTVLTWRHTADAMHGLSLDGTGLITLT
jgi:hypothetical protein